MRVIKYIRRFKSAIMLPYGVDEQFDEDCDASFSRALDIVYYAGVTLYVSYALVLAALLIT